LGLSNYFRCVYPAQLAAEFEQIKPISGKGKNFVWHVSFSAIPGEYFSLDEWRDKGERLFNKVGQLANRKPLQSLQVKSPLLFFTRLSWFIK
jgi:hypothetical protein